MTAASSSSFESPRATTEVGDDDHGPALAPPEAAGRPLIEVSNLGVWYRLHKRRRRSLKEMLLSGRLRHNAPLLWALRGVSFTCHEGQALGIVGSNGAGKSTLCLVLAQILTPDEGSICVRAKASPVLTLGAGLNRNLSGRANIQLCGAFIGIPRATLKEKIDEIIAFSELGDFIDEPVRQYSGGMKARLGFSILTVLEPQILILDEVFAVGDRAFRAKGQRRLEEIMAESKLIVIVSHTLGFLREVCTQCLWLEHGRAVQYGEAEEVLDAYEEKTGNSKPRPKQGSGVRGRGSGGAPL